MTKVMLNNTVLIKRLDVDDSLTDGGLHRPEVAQKRSNRGEVLAVCADEKEISVGDVVVFTRYGGTTVEIGDDERLIVNKKQLYWIEKPMTLALDPIPVVDMNRAI